MKKLLHISIFTSLLSVSSVWAQTETEGDLSLDQQEITQLLEVGKESSAFSKAAVLAKSDDAWAMNFIATLMMDKDSIYFDEEVAFHYFKGAVRKGHLKSYPPMIELMINPEHKAYDTSKASIFAQGYFDKGGEGAESLLSYVLLVAGDKDSEKILSLAVDGYEKKQDYSLLALAFIYEQGVGVHRNLKKSMNYFKLAQSKGFNVESQISEVRKELDSPKIGSLILVGAKRELVSAAVVKQGGNLISSKGNVDIYHFEKNKTGVVSITLVYVNAELGALKYIFNAARGTNIASLLRKKLKLHYGKPDKVISKATEWSMPDVHVSLSTKDKCLKECVESGNDALKARFISLEYQFPATYNAPHNGEELEDANPFTF